MANARVASAQALCEWLEQMLEAASKADWDALGDMAEQHSQRSQALRQAVQQGPEREDPVSREELRQWLMRASQLHAELLMLAEPQRDALGQELAQGRRQHALGRAYMG
jgi:hypothetical protein